jgi:ATP-dependent Clp protease adaptor protein ClpS
MNFNQKKQELFEEVLQAQSVKYSLVLLNDDYNTFDYVIECLTQVCNHTPEQAEQCALITHYNGKCEVKLGSKTDLMHLKEILQEMGLSVVIEKNN